MMGLPRTMSLVCTDATAPVKSDFLISPYPTTTTSLSNKSSCFKVTLIVVWLPTTISWVRKPVKLNTRMLFSSGTSTRNSPLTLVMSPMVVPLTNTLVPGKASPAASVTLPVMVLSGMVTDRGADCRGLTTLKRLFLSGVFLSKVGTLLSSVFRVSLVLDFSFFCTGATTT